MDWIGWPPDGWLTWGGSAIVAVDLAFRVVAAAVVANKRRPSSAVAWLLAIFFVPFLGLVAFLLVGSSKLPRRRRRKQRRISEVILERTADFDFEIPDDAPTWLAPVVRMNRTLGAMPLVRDTTATLETDYETSLAIMTAEVESAQTYVHAEFYILSCDATTEPFFAAMEDAAARGVTVRVLFDHLASLRIPGYRATCRRMTSAGIEWHPMLPITPFKREILRPDLRNHRKILVVDGRTGFVGSQNLIDARYGKRANREKGREWIDIMARLTGPVVTELDAVFRTDWYSETDELLDSPVTPEERALTSDGADSSDDGTAGGVGGRGSGDSGARDESAEALRDLLVPDTVAQALPPRTVAELIDGEAVGDLYAQVVPSGPGFDAENNLALFNSLIYNARERVSMVSPYFVPDESLLMAIITAAHRGLAVELFVSERSDQLLVHHAQRSYYQVLLEAGVDIWFYPRPWVLHAKTLTVDDQISVVGSSNMDIRSFTLNLECSVMIEGHGMCHQLRTYENQLRAASRRLELRAWKRRPYREQVLDGVCRLTSALM